MKVLVVDDKHVNRKMMMMILNALGHEVDVAEDGHAACAMAEASTYEIIFMDLHMPVMNGIEAMERIKALPKPTPRMVVVTADTTDESRLRALSVGADVVETKPVDVAKLKRLLDFVP
jgi:CheY-like chemotaxis protein